MPKGELAPSLLETEQIEVSMNGEENLDAKFFPEHTGSNSKTLGHCATTNIDLLPSTRSYTQVGVCECEENLESE